jgi:predicted nucleic acid-binding protein
MEIKAISDAGPIIHLSEIGISTCFSLFSKVLVPREVYNEVKVCNLPGNNEIESKIFEIVDIASNKKDKIEYFSTKYDISIPDGSVITLSKYTGINLVLSDDPDVRDVLKSMGMRPVGSIGILLRAYSERIISYDDAAKALEDLLEIPSLYVTSRLIQNAKKALKEYDAGHKME